MNDLDLNDFPLIAVNGCVQSRSRGFLFSTPLPQLADAIVFRLNRDYAAQLGGAPNWGLQPGGFERMLIVVGEEGRRRRAAEFASRPSAEP